MSSKPSPHEEVEAPYQAPEVEALLASFGTLHEHSDRNQLAEAYSSAMERIPPEAIKQAHAAQLELGNYKELEVVKVSSHSAGIPHHLFEDRPVLVRTHIRRAQGMLTTITPSHMPGFQRDIYYAEWLYSRIWNRR